MNNLEKEIQEQSSQIYRDSYQMSIGELINLYKENEMEIHPEFQRVYRWTEHQKTMLIESILLNIPVPSIFVSQDKSGVWDIVDGVQRLSTIFQLVGILKDDENNEIDPLILEKTDYLPSLENYVWELDAMSDEQKQSKRDLKEFSPQQRIDFKRSRIDVVIVKKESDSKVKYELFQRLNTGGTRLSEQEVRNCLLVMTNKVFYYKLVGLEDNADFQTTTALLTNKKSAEQFGKELLLRLLVAYDNDDQNYKEFNDMVELLNNESMRISGSEDFDFLTFKDKFERAFRIIANALGEDAFRRYIKESEKFGGPLLSGSFQSITVGVMKNIDFVESEGKEWLFNKVKEMYGEPDFENNFNPGVRPITRHKGLSDFGISYFGS